MSTILRATQARVHLGVLRGNLAALRRGLPRGTAVCAAVKANAYGHGAPRVSRVLREEGVEMLGVSSPFEGLELREAGDKGRIMIFGPSVPEELEITIAAGLETVVTDLSFVDALEAALDKAPGKHILPVHLKVDTGMGRVGCRPGEALPIARRLAGHPKLKIAGLCTHFASADSHRAEDREFTAEQAAALMRSAAELKEAGIDWGMLHLGNSGALVSAPEFSRDMVRPGIALYGYGIQPEGGAPLRPVMEFVTRITAIKRVRAGETVSYGRTWKAERDCIIATLPVGYADGYPRLLSNRAEVLIGGRRRPVAGRVCMDQTMVNMGRTSDVSLYDEALLFGGDEAGPDAAELAGLAETIPYEITCGISARVPRVYTDSPRDTPAGH